MSLVIYAVDSEFASATGANVNSGPGTSSFDYPPNGTKDLVITSNEGDSGPYLFEVGDTYDLSWGGSTGTTIEDATVIRSDVFPDGGAVVVFEGVDSSGNLAQIIWTPDFNLEGWYWDHYTPSANPGFYTADQDAGTTYQHICFSADTLIATPGGLRTAGGLEVGDRVMTIDAGAQAVAWIGRRRTPGIKSGAPVLIAEGVLGNARPLRLSQNHRVLLAGPQVAREAGAPEVLVPAKALLGRPGVALAPTRTIDYVHILLERHELVRAEGTQCETLFLGAMALKAIRDGAGSAAADYPALPDFARGPRAAAMAPARPFVEGQTARVLVAALAGAPLFAGTTAFKPAQARGRSTSSTRTLAPGSAIRAIGTPVEAGPGGV